MAIERIEPGDTFDNSPRAAITITIVTYLHSIILVTCFFRGRLTKNNQSRT
jgi:hypothetical protein